MQIRIHVARLAALVALILPLVLAACGNGGKVSGY
jgi:hypothetical protein